MLSVFLKMAEHIEIQLAIDAKCNSVCLVHFLNNLPTHSREMLILQTI